jgi:hypothetical protein
MKIVINSCYGGFSISKKCAEYLAERGHETAKKELKKWNKRKKLMDYYLKNGKFPKGAVGTDFLKIDAKYKKEPEFYGYDYGRDDQDLVKAVEELGEAASGKCAKLKVIEIPDGIEWEIDDYDGMESVHEKHSSWS